MENHQKLLSLYNELDESLRAYYKETNFSSSVIMRFIKELEHSGSRVYEDYGRKLNMIRIIRNDLIHDLDMNSEKLISVNDETIKFLDELVTVIKHPVLALDIATKMKDLSYITLDAQDTYVIDLIKRMRQQGFSQIPVLTNKNVLFGVFSANVIFEYLKDGNPNIENLKLRDILDLLPIDKHYSESYFFVKSTLNIRDLSDKLLVSYESNKKPAMVFITNHGEEKEPLLGVAVISDIAKAF